MKTMFFVILFGVFSFSSISHAAVNVLSSESSAVDEFTAGFVMMFSVESDGDFDLYIENVPTTFTSTVTGGGEIVSSFITFNIDGSEYTDFDPQGLYFVLEPRKTVVITTNWFLQADEDTSVELVVDSFNYHFDSPDAPLTYYAINAYGNFVEIQGTFVPEPSTFFLVVGSLTCVLKRKRH